MIVIASDHGGYSLKQELMAHLKEKGVEFEDIGTYSEASCNYPEYAERAARGGGGRGRRQRAIIKSRPSRGSCGGWGRCGALRRENI